MASYTLKELRSITVDELVKRHDEQAGRTEVGVSYYLEELARRDQERTNRVLIGLTVALTVLTLVIAILTLVLLLKE